MMIVRPRSSHPLPSLVSTVSSISYLLRKVLVEFPWSAFIPVGRVIAMPSHNQEVINCWQQGDADAFTQIVRDWQVPVCRFLGRLVDQADNVPDLCQEVFLRIHRAGHRYRENGAFHTWVYRIALNVARDAARLDRRRPTTSQFTDAESAVASSDPNLEHREMTEAIAACVAGLPTEQREVLVLRHYEDMSFVEMSRLLDTPESTLKSRFTAALQQLRLQLRSRGFAPGDEES